MNDEIIPADDAVEAARELDSGIRALARQAHIVLTALYVLVEEAKATRVHVTLGYPSWTAYLADALDGEWKSMVEGDKRKEVARFLGEQGMSQRAIAKTVGVSKNTVTSWLRGVPTLGQLITGLDGKTYPRPEPSQSGTAGEESDEEFLERLRAEKASGTVTIPTTIEAAAARLRQLGEDEERVTRIQFERMFAWVAQQPVSATRNAHEFGLVMRWQRTKALWLMEDGLSIEEVADAMGASVLMVEDYLDSPTCSNEEYFAYLLAGGDDETNRHGAGGEGETP